MRATALLLLLAGVMAADSPVLRRQAQSPTRSFDSEFPSKTTVPRVAACADECYALARNQTTDCPGGDVACLCTQPEVQGFVQSCLESSCTTKEYEAAAQYGIDLCRAAAPGGSGVANNATSASATATPAAGSKASPAPSQSPSPSSVGTNNAQAGDNQDQNQNQNQDPNPNPGQSPNPSQSQGNGVSDIVVTSSLSTTIPPLPSAPGPSSNASLIPPMTLTSTVVTAARTSAGSSSNATNARTSAVSPSKTGAASARSHGALVGLLFAAGVVTLAL